MTRLKELINKFGKEKVLEMALKIDEQLAMDLLVSKLDESKSNLKPNLNKNTDNDG